MSLLISFLNFLGGTVMKITGLNLLLCSALFLLFSGCAKTTSDVSPDAAMGEFKNFYVVPSFDDRRGVKEAIFADLKSRGFNVEAGPAIRIPETADVEVSYEAKWVWDRDYYLSNLEISFKDPDNAMLIASGKSYRPSLERKPVDDMVGEILNQIFMIAP